jgi:LPS-assembly lipoprotein
MKRRLFLAAFPAALLAGCGFKLRRLEDMPFSSLYLDAPSNSAVAVRIRSSLARSKITRLTATAAEAEAVLKLSNEERSKIILSLSGAGRVTEFRLGLRLTYSLVANDGRSLAAPETLELIRDMTFDDTQVLAKAAEEELLFRDMVDNAAQRILRRLQSINPAAAT